MEELHTLSSLSIGEMRKILNDNGIPETNVSSKDELMNMVEDFLLSKLMIEQISKELDHEYNESREISECLEQSKKEHKQSEDINIKLIQDLEYEQCVKDDTHNIISGELSPNSLREKRLKYFT